MPRRRHVVAARRNQRLAATPGRAASVGDGGIVDTRPLGSSGIAVTPIGFGAFKIGRNEGIKYPSAYSLPTDAESERLIHQILDLGVNYIDTAPAYGVSEERIGRAI